MTIVGVLAAVVAIVLLTVRESLSVGSEPTGGSSTRVGFKVPHWVDAAVVVLATVALLPRLWDLLT